MSQFPTSPLFDPQAYFMRLRATLRPDMKIRSLFHVLDRQIQDEGWPDVYGGDRAAYYAANGISFIPTEQYVYVFRGSDPTSELNCSAPPAFTLTDAHPNRRLELSFRLADWTCDKEVACRAYLIEPEAFVRLVHAMHGFIRGRQPFRQFRGAYYRHRRRYPVTLMIPPQDESRPRQIAAVGSALQLFFGRAVVRYFHAARQLAALPEIEGVVRPDGVGHLEVLVPGDDPHGRRNNVELEDLRLRVVVALIVDA